MTLMDKKLIYILNSYSTTDSSHFHHVLGLLEALAERGIKIALVIEKTDGAPVFRSPNIKVVTLKHRFPLLRAMELFKNLCILIRQGFDRTYIRIAAPAALTATLAHRLFGGATFFWQSGTTLEFDREQPFNRKKIRWYLASHIPSILARRFVHYFVTGPAFMVDYYANVAGVQRGKIRLLYNDIDIQRFAPDPKQTAQKASFLTEHGLAPGTLVLLLVHRLSPVRRTGLYFPNCLSHLKDAGVIGQVAIVVAGAGSELPEIKKQIHDLKLDDRCIFLGSVPNKEIERLYAIADIFLHPTYNEGFPRVVLEAMAAGLPIVSTDAGGTRELMGELQSSLVVPRDEPASFSTCLEILVRDSGLRQRLARENAAHVERFSTVKVAAMYEKVLFE